MVEPLFKYSAATAVGQVVALDGDEGHHAAAVRRMRVGEAIALTDGATRHSRGVVKVVHPKFLEIEINEVRQIEPAKISFGLVQALAKGDRDELAVQAGTELGVETVIPWQSERSISRWEGAKIAKQVARWQSISEEASKQSLRPRFVKVEEPLTSKQLAAQVSANDALWLVLEPTASQSIAEIDLSEQSKVFLVVGAEGGISDSELQMFEQAGAKGVHMGTGVLRTSTAGVAALAFLAGNNGLWG